MGGGSVFLILCETLVAIVFGHKIHIFIPKFGQNSILIPKSTYGGGATGLGIIPKKNSFFTASLR